MRNDAPDPSSIRFPKQLCRGHVQAVSDTGTFEIHDVPGQGEAIARQLARQIKKDQIKKDKDN